MEGVLRGSMKGGKVVWGWGYGGGKGGVGGRWWYESRWWYEGG